MMLILLLTVGAAATILAWPHRGGGAFGWRAAQIVGFSTVGAALLLTGHTFLGLFSFMMGGPVLALTWLREALLTDGARMEAARKPTSSRSVVARIVREKALRIDDAVKAVFGAARSRTRKKAADETAGDRMTLAEARRVLGLPPVAGPKEVMMAYRLAIAVAHPDAGGSHERAARVNIARDTLLRPYGARGARSGVRKAA